MTSTLLLLAAVASAALGAWLVRGWRDRQRAWGTFEHSTRRAAEAEARAERLEQRLQALLDAFPHGAVLFDSDGRPGRANEAGQAFVGARHGNAIVEGAARDLVREVTRSGQDGAAIPAHRLVELAGKPRQAVDVVACRLSDGGAAVFLEDVSERRRLAEVRRDFVANISHELRTPIGAIAVLTEAMVAEDDPALLLRLAGKLHGEATRVSRTIEDLLLLSRIENDEAPRRGPVAVAEVLREAMERVSSAAAERRIELRVDVAHPAATVHGDRRQLVSAVFNLVDNAVKYSDPESLVVLRALAADGPEGGEVRIEVEDNGIGIPARDLERIFERFYRVDQARSRRTGGTGLGLAIVRHVAANHGGHVTARSCEGQGSTFVLTIPTGRPPACLSSRPAEPCPTVIPIAPEVA